MGKSNIPLPTHTSVEKQNFTTNSNTELTYGRILSFDGILNDMETHQAILASLMGNDCQEQVRDYAIGMMAQGVDREEIKSVRAIILNIAKHFEVTFYKDPAQIPSIAAVQTGTVPSWTEFMN